MKLLISSILMLIVAAAVVGLSGAVAAIETKPGQVNVPLWPTLVPLTLSAVFFAGWWWGL